jgi:hypothetical protein
VGHGKHNPALAAGDVVKEMNDFPLGTGIKPTGDLVAKKEFGVGNQFHGESKTAFLTTGENADGAVRDWS